MKKKNISLARAYLAFYIIFIFTAAIPVLLSFKIAPALSIVFIVLEALCLGGVITSNVFYDKGDNKKYYISSIASFGAFDVFFLYGFILEIVYSAQGQSASYAWMINIISLIALGLIDLFVAFGIERLVHPREEINAY